jgi:hypothetical protein
MNKSVKKTRIEKGMREKNRKGQGEKSTVHSVELW